MKAKVILSDATVDKIQLELTEDQAKGLFALYERIRTASWTGEDFYPTPADVYLAEELYHVGRRIDFN